MDGTVLVADDDRSIRTVLTQALTRAGCRVHATGSLQQLLRWAEEGRGDLVVTDVMMPDGNGIDMIPAIRRARPDLPVIVISAQNTIVTTIRATEADAFDYLPKPFDLPDLLARSRDALARRPRLSDPEPAAPAEPAPDLAGLPLIGHAQAMQAMFRLVARVLNVDLPVMVTGDAGAGKTMVARAIHDLSARAQRPLVVVGPADAAAGEARDPLARAFAQAAGGSVLIENPAGFDAAAQARLLALIEASGADAPRLISTGAAEAAEGLRPDLFYRLAAVTVAVPPLTARLDDLPALSAHFLARAAAQGLGARSLSEAALAVLRAHPFPGNLRELDNLMRRLALTGAGEIGADEITAALHPADRKPSPVVQGRLSDAVAAHLSRYFDLHGEALPPPGLYDRILREIEAPLLEIALDATQGNQLRCAELLGINRNTLRKKLTDLNIQVTRRRKLM
ncbi:MAG: response regulator [Paracoccus sp. (in: a-proteobacteria)]|nr:response regulator [Paracoccus sp. (in: a-proteobacteria)]